jgi:intein-encoded DNA endonuclease-like protein
MCSSEHTLQKIKDLNLPFAGYQVVSDEEFEQELSDRLSRLGEAYSEEFYRNRSSRSKDPYLSGRDLDLLILEAMERSYCHCDGNSIAEEK